MKIFGSDNSELMTVSAIERSGNELVLKGKIFGAMPMLAKVRPEEARAALRLLDCKTVIFLLSLLFRPSSKKPKN
jgi:LmbE family N-acetylglucosaminyl deacetylase